MEGNESDNGGFCKSKILKVKTTVKPVLFL